MGAQGRGAVGVVLFVASLTAPACNRGAAQESLRVAEEALEEARADLDQLAPGELERLRQALEAARAQLEEGRYTDALRTAQAFPARVRVARARVERRRRELLSAWGELSGRVPASLGRHQQRLALRAEPSAGVAEARRALAEIKIRWTEARRTHQAGDVARAVAIGRDVEARLRALSGEVSRLPARRVVTAAEQDEGR